MDKVRHIPGAAMVRAALLALLALAVGGCEFARTTVPYEPAPDMAQSDALGDDWAAARADCARAGRVPVQQYQWAVLRRQATFSCELPGQMTQGAAAEAR
jgi:hypothetical protein